MSGLIEMTDYEVREKMNSSGFNTASAALQRYSSPLLRPSWEAFRASAGDLFVNQDGSLFRAPRFLKRKAIQVLSQSA